MSFDGIADSILAVVRKHADYSERNTAKYEYRLLARGLRRALVVQYGGTAEDRQVAQTPRRIHMPWLANLELFIPYRDMNSIGRDVVTDAQALIDHLDKYPTLNGALGVVNAFVVRASEAQPWQASSRWWLVVLQMRVDERTTITIAE